MIMWVFSDFIFNLLNKGYSDFVFSVFMNSPSPMFLTSMSDRIGYFLLSTFLSSAGDPWALLLFSDSSLFYKWSDYWFPLWLGVFFIVWIMWNIIQYSLWQLIPNNKREMSSGDTWIWYTVLFPVVGLFSYLYIGWKYRISWKVFLKWSVKIMLLRIILGYVIGIIRFVLTETFEKERLANYMEDVMVVLFPLLLVTYLYWRGRREQK